MKCRVCEAALLDAELCNTLILAIGPTGKCILCMTFCVIHSHHATEVDTICVPGCVHVVDPCAQPHDRHQQESIQRCVQHYCTPTHTLSG